MQSHPAAEIFPLMAGADFEALVSDIRDNGQREPIVVHEGLILDGRNRFRACRQIGIEPRTENWTPIGTPETFVISMNLHRRHLNESQRAIIAAELVTLKNGQRADRMKAKNQAAGCPMATVSVADAAEAAKVSKDTISQARTVLDNATPEEIEAIKRGRNTVNTVAEQIRKKMSPQKRKASSDEGLADRGRNPDRIERMRAEADIWANLKQGLAALTSLPLPSEVAAMVRKNPQRSQLVDQRLSRSLNYLKELHDVWNQ